MGKNNKEKISTGFGTLDALWGGGFERGRLGGFLLADRGQRSEFAFQLAKQMSAESRIVLFSLEVGRGKGIAMLGRLLREETALDDGDRSLAEQLSILEAVFGELKSKLSVRYEAGSLAEVTGAAKGADVVVVDGLESLVEISGCDPHPTCELRKAAKESGALVIIMADLDRGRIRKGGPRYTDRRDKGARFDFVVIPYMSACAYEPAPGKNRRDERLRIVCEDRTRKTISFDGAIEFSEKAGRFLDVPGSVGCGKLWFRLDAAPYQEWRKASQPGEDEGDASRKMGMLIASMIPDAAERPFCQSRNDANGKGTVDKLFGALLDFREEIEFPPGLATCLGGYLELLKHDYPELVFVRTTPNVAEDTPKRVVFRPNYRLSREEAAQILSEMEAKAAPVLAKALKLGVNERFEFLHDWIAVGVEFDLSSTDECREAYGPLLHGRGNEMGIVKAWHYLCARAGLMAGATVGSYLGTQWPWSVCAFEGGGRQGGGSGRKWCHVDIAADTMVSRGYARHDYFGLSDEEVFFDHEASFEMMARYRRPCPESLDYFGRRGLALFRGLEVSDLLQEVADGDERRIEFQMPFRRADGGDADFEVRVAADDAARCMPGGGWAARVEHNDRRMVFDVSFGAL